VGQFEISFHKQNDFRLQKHFKKLSDQSGNLFQRPNMIRNARLHCRCNPQRLVNPAEVVIHEIKSRGEEMVFNLLTESVGQPCKASHAHTHSEVLPLNETC